MLSSNVHSEAVALFIPSFGTSISYPNLEIFLSRGSFIIFILLPSTRINFSLTKDINVLIALEVVMFDRFARSSRLMYIFNVESSSS